MKTARKKYVRIQISFFNEEMIKSIEAQASCSGCGGKCHRGNN